MSRSEEGDGLLRRGLPAIRPDILEDRPNARRLANGFDPAARQKRQFDQLVAFTQKLWRDSDAAPQGVLGEGRHHVAGGVGEVGEWYRDYFHNEVIGKLPEPTMPLNPRIAAVYDEPKWTGYEVMLDVYPDVFA